MSNIENVSPNPLPNAPPQEPLPPAREYQADIDFECIDEAWQECLCNLELACGLVAEMTKTLSQTDQEYVRAKLGFTSAMVSKMIAFSNDPIWELGFNIYNGIPVRRELLYKHQLICNPASCTQS